LHDSTNLKSNHGGLIEQLDASFRAILYRGPLAVPSSSCHAVTVLPCCRRLAVLLLSSCRAIAVLLSGRRRFAVPSCPAAAAVLLSCHLTMSCCVAAALQSLAAMDDNSKISPNVGSYLVYLVRRATDRSIRFFVPSDVNLTGIGNWQGWDC
jgi:hypothetical protein